jgi:hypothetical protein
MGRNATADWLDHYRSVLVATSVRALRGRLPAARAFALAQRRTWLGADADEGGWRAMAVAAAALPDRAALR